jgi:hypothetical protein
MADEINFTLNDRPDISQTANIFREELLDPELELFHQDTTARTFPRFQDLPAELRCQIWNIIRPRNIHTKVEVNYREDKYRLKIVTKTKTPITFRINRESRYYTMGLYDEPQLQAPEEARPRALHSYYFDPNVDTVAIFNPYDFDCLAEEEEEFRQGTGAALDMEDLDIIQSLQIGDQNVDHWDDNWDEAYIDDDYAAIPRCYGLFRGLKELTIFGGTSQLVDQADFLECRETMTAYYEQLQERYPDSKMPNIKAHMPCGRKKLGRFTVCAHCAFKRNGSGSSFHTSPWDECN